MVEFLEFFEPKFRRGGIFRPQHRKTQTANVNAKTQKPTKYEARPEFCLEMG